MGFSFFIITGEKVHNIARYECLACRDRRMRSEMGIFAESGYNFDNAIVRFSFLKHWREIFDNLHYVCKICYYSLRKEKGREPKFPEKKSKIDEPDVYFCTCCHLEKKSRKQIVYFKLKNYDFGNKVVSKGIGKRCSLQKVHD